MKRFDLASGIFWLVFSVVVAVESYRLGLGHARSPGPGFVPFFISLFFASLSTVLLIATARNKPGAALSTTPSPAPDGIKIGFVVGALAVYVFLLEKMGFLVCTFLLILFLLKAVEKLPWPTVLTIATVATFATYVVFYSWLRIQLPPGMFSVYF